LKVGFDEGDINFETIINIIEEYIVYYSYYNSKKEIPSLSKTFFSSRFEEMILNFSIHGGEKNTITH
jgi:hypothetical protein